MESNFEMDELEKLYAPSCWSQKFKPDEIFDIHSNLFTQESDVMKKQVQCRLDVPYANTPASKIDLFGDENLPKDAPIFIFVHGGYWIIGCRQVSSYFVKPFVDAGVVCAVVGYDLISDTVLLPDMVAQIQDAINYILDYAQARNSRGVYLCGHSAGAHLIVMAMTSAMKSDKFELLKGIIPISGLFDLHPLLPTSIAPAAKITEEIADICSPLKFVSKLKENLSPSTEVVVVVAEFESPAFIDQSKTYYEALKATGLNTNFIFVKEEDHFTIIEVIRKADHDFTKKILDLIKKSE